MSLRAMSQLIPCSACGRHVRASGEACPFCEAPLGSVQPASSSLRVTRAQLTRAALFAGATVIAAACGGADSGGAAEPDPEGNAFVQPYGAPAIEEEESTEATESDEGGGAETQAVAPPYGAPPVEDDPADEAPPEE